MAKDLTTSNLAVVVENGSLKVVSALGDTEARLGHVYLDGQRLHGVFAEILPGQLDVVASSGRGDAEDVVVPVDAKRRAEFLRKWSDSAQKAGRAKKAGGATLLLLSLAACGGGGSGVSLKTATLNVDDQVIDTLTGATGGARIDVVNAGDNLYEAVTVTASGAGSIEFKFADSDDVVELSAGTSFAGFSTIIVSGGTVDFRLADLGGATIVQVNSGAILSADQYLGLTSVVSAGDGEVAVIVDSVEEAVAVAAHDINDGASLVIETAEGDVIATNVDGSEALQGIEEFVGSFSVTDTAEELLTAQPGALDGAEFVAVTGNDAGELSVAEYSALKLITQPAVNDNWSYDIVDDKENIFNVSAEGVVTIKAGVSLILAGASSVEITGTLSAAEKAALDTLGLDTVVSLTVDSTPPTVALSASVAEVLNGGTATINFTFSEAVTGFSLADVSFDSALGSLTDLEQDVDNPLVYSATFTAAADKKQDVTFTVASSKFTDIAGNLNADGADLSNSVAVALNTFTFSVSEADSVVTFGGSASGDITVEIQDGDATFSRGDLTAATSIEDLASKTIEIAAGQTLVLTVEQVRELAGLTLQGDGAVSVVGALTVSEAFSIITDDLNGGGSVSVEDEKSEIFSGLPGGATRESW